MAHDVWPFGQKDIVAKPELVFIGDEDKGSKLVTQTASATVKVRVNAPFRVVHNGSAHTGGDVLQVPLDDTTKLWIKARWVEELPVAQKGK
ncbi:hypothetical protein [Mycobacterium kyorinense]|uniref:Uncharacterized protein n=1 Tax=Mycobacterium kyorinense TaxID=487514 RepID=A0A1X1XUD4_9MYCO|nr:hypothetical protein [Mycobacterium kyorinense]ORW02472.1 hypothetical protein AWC14_06980 [Mycobacterium kyorinense]